MMRMRLLVVLLVMLLVMLLVVVTMAPHWSTTAFAAIVLLLFLLIITILIILFLVMVMMVRTMFHMAAAMCAIESMHGMMRSITTMVRTLAVHWMSTIGRISRRRSIASCGCLAIG